MNISSHLVNHVAIAMTVQQAEDLRTFLLGTTAGSRERAMLNNDKYNDDTLIEIHNALAGTLGKKERK